MYTRRLGRRIFRAHLYSRLLQVSLTRSQGCMQVLGRKISSTANCNTPGTSGSVYATNMHDIRLIRPFIYSDRNSDQARPHPHQADPRVLPKLDSNGTWIQRLHYTKPGSSTRQTQCEKMARVAKSFKTYMRMG